MADTFLSPLVQIRLMPAVSTTSHPAPARSAVECVALVDVDCSGGANEPSAPCAHVCVTTASSCTARDARCRIMNDNGCGSAAASASSMPLAGFGWNISGYGEDQEQRGYFYRS